MNNLGFAHESHKISTLAQTVDDNGGVVFVTAFSGLFAPYWIDSAKGTMFGITAHTKQGHIARATLEATCFQTKAILDAMEKDSGHKLKELAVDGGMSNSDVCMQVRHGRGFPPFFSGVVLQMLTPAMVTDTSRLDRHTCRSTAHARNDCIGSCNRGRICGGCVEAL